MVAGGISAKSYSEIMSGQKTTIAMTSCSNFVRNYHLHQLTHLSLPDEKAVELKGITTQEQKPYRSSQNKTVEYTVFELGKVVRRQSEDTFKNIKAKNALIPGVKSCRVISDLQLNGVKFHINDNCHFKISKYQTIEGDRYLVFIANTFGAGFSEQEFKNTFEVLEK
jgi:hypothetical protein